MPPILNQPGRLFATAKTHKFDCINDITLEQLKFRPIIDQTGTYIHNASNVFEKYLRSLSKNKFSNDDTFTFLKFLRNAEKSDDCKDVSYDVEGFFVSIPVKETIV